MKQYYIYVNLCLLRLSIGGDIAVLAALAMVASVLVAAPAVAADDPPEPSFEAVFDACEGVPSSGFEDVPARHANAVDCIAYYGITKGTSATTYAPKMSVTREHMALFLTRLAALVGIPVVSNPDDSGFTDTGDLSTESQTAIAQLADLDITQGTSATTYSPGDSVTRGQMALFIQRLMDKMDPMAEDDDTPFGYKPEDVIDVPDGDDADDVADKTVKSPFTNINSVTVLTNNAITALWELGVASGIAETAYGPSVLITREHMAEFMAGVLDHSNARPAGVTIQASKTWDYDDFDATVAVSYRDDSFMPMVDVSIKTFFTGNDGDADGVGSLNEDGSCETASDCAWNDDELLTDDSGNIYIAGGVTDGKKNTYYAWMGDEDNTDFDVDESAHGSVTLSSTTDATGLKVTSSISSNSTTDNTVDIDSGKSVTYTVQLVDDDGGSVAKSGVEISVAENRGGSSPVFPAHAPLETDDDGQVTFTAGGPESTKGNTDALRVDTVTFSSDVNEDNTTGNAQTSETQENTINWSDTDAVLTSGMGSAPAYAVLNSKDEVTIRGSVTFYDQYGNTIGKGNKVNIQIGDETAATRTVSSKGVASWSDTEVPTPANQGDPVRGSTVTVIYDNITDSAGTAIQNAPNVTESTVTAVEHAPDDSSANAADLDEVYGDDNGFRIAGLSYIYDSDDTFVDGTDNGAVVDMAKFATRIGANLDEITTEANVQVVSYDDDGSSIFRVVTAAS